MNQTPDHQPTMDVRTFFGRPKATEAPETKTETKPKPKPRKAFTFEGHPNLEAMRKKWIRDNLLLLRAAALSGKRATKEERAAAEEHFRQLRRLWKISGRTGLGGPGGGPEEDAVIEELKAEGKWWC